MLAGALEPRYDELAEQMAREIHEEVVELDHDAELLEEARASSRANLAIAMPRLCEGADPSAVGVAGEALRYAQELVRRGASLGVLLRAYRIGHASFWRTWLELAWERIDDRELLGEVVRFSSAWAFGFIDAVSDSLTTEYMEERERWVRSAAAVRADTVSAILDGRVGDVREASRRLRYELARRHAGFVAWSDPGDENAPGLDALERVGLRVAAAVGARDPLLVPLGTHVLAGWIGAHGELEPERIERLAAADDPSRAWVAFGSPADGPEGFRASHEEALLARRVARLLGRRAGSVTYYGRVALLALLTEDLAQARRFVERELGPLAGDDDAVLRLAATLRVYFEEGSSPARAARRLGIHENTVAYRIHRAEDLLGRRVTERPFELTAALALADAVRGREPATGA